MRLIETEIRQLKHKILDMAELVQNQFDLLSQAMHNLDHDLAERIRKKEAEIDRFDTKIDKRCARILALYQPVANDLRFVFAVLKINSMLEQIGDAINYIARKTLKMQGPLPDGLQEQLHLQEMFECTQELMRTALQAFFSDDTRLARTVVYMDDRVDDIHRAAFGLLTEAMKKQPKQVHNLALMLLIVKHIEKIADYCVSIADESIYYVDAVVHKHAHKRYNQPEAAVPPNQPGPGNAVPLPVHDGGSAKA